jgi:hypothetical protein
MFHTLVHRNLQAMLLHYNFEEIYEKKATEIRDKLKIILHQKSNIQYYVNSDKTIYDLICETMEWDKNDVICWVVVYMYLSEILEFSEITISTLLCYLFPLKAKTFSIYLSHQIIIYVLDKQIFP